MRYDTVIDTIGHTPLLRLALDAPATAYAKLELSNIFAMKDRVAKQVVLAAKRSGALADGAPIIESSSGTMALGLALVGRALGHPVHIVTDPRIDIVTAAKLRSLGCAVHVVDAMSGAGWQSARLELLAQLLTELPGAFWPQQYSNPQNPAAYQAVADEILDDLGTVDVLVGAVGSGGSLCGTARALRGRLPALRVVAVDCAGSMIFGQPDRPQRLQSGLGNSMQAPNVDYDVIDEVHWLADDEAFAATRRLALEQQLFAGNSSGSVYQVLRRLAADAAPDTTLVGIFPDRGDRYADTVFADSADAPAVPSADPVEVAYGSVVDRWSFARLPRPRPQLVFVESNTTGSGMIALRTAHRLATRPVLLTSSPQRYAGLADTGAEVIECPTDDPVAVSAAVDRLATAAPLAGITTTSEYSLVATAELADGHRMLGNTVAALRICRNKAATRQALTDAGLRQPRFVVADGSFAEISDAVLADAVGEIGLPCVVKPLEDSGSHHVRLCTDLAAVRRQVDEIVATRVNVRGQPTPQAALIEQHLDGQEISVEMVSVDGTAQCVGITAKTVQGSPHFVEVRHIFPAPLPVHISAAAVGSARDVLAASGFRLGAAHLEFKLTADGPMLVEINARLAGGMIPDLIRLATGIDMVEQQLRCAIGLPVQLSPTRDRVAGIHFLTVPQAGLLAGIDGIADALRVPGIDRVAVTVADGSPVLPATDAYQRLGYLIAVQETADQVAAALDRALERLTVRVDPADTARSEPAGSSPALSESARPGPVGSGPVTAEPVAPEPVLATAATAQTEGDRR